MISLKTIIILLTLHFISDFFLQSDKMALNKSKNAWVLLLHCIIYSIIFIGFGWKFVILVFVSHFIIDFVSSKVSAGFWRSGQRHWFFVSVGFDQLLHTSLLFVFYIILKGR